MAVSSPVKVEAPVTARVDCRVAAPATVRLEDKVETPETVKVLSKVEGLLERKVSVLLPPKEAPLEERLVKEPNWPEKDLAEKEPVAEIELVERWLVVMVLAFKKLVSRDWGLKLPVKVRLFKVASLVTVRDWKVALPKTLREPWTEASAAIAKLLACKRLSAIKLDKVWMVLAVWMVEGLVKVK
mgnify:CR=1 FL=1